MMDDEVPDYIKANGVSYKKRGPTFLFLFFVSVLRVEIETSRTRQRQALKLRGSWCGTLALHLGGD